MSIIIMMSACTLMAALFERPEKPKQKPQGRAIRKTKQRRYK